MAISGLVRHCVAKTKASRIRSGVVSRQLLPCGPNQLLIVGAIAGRTSRNRVARVSDHPEFRFTVQLWKGFTHERNANSADEKLFKGGMEPLADAGRLNAILLQFPWSFRNEPENRNYLRQLRDRFAEYPLVLRYAIVAGLSLMCWICSRHVAPK